MTAVWMRVRAGMRGRGREIIVLSLVAGLLGGAVLLAFAGARQTSTAFARLLDRTNAHDVEVSIVEDAPPDVLERVGALPMVEAWARAAILPADEPGVPFRWNMSVAALIDPDMFHEINRPLIHAGRLPDPDDPREAVVSREFAVARDVRVGDEVPFVALTFPEMFTFFGGQRVTPSSPPFRVRVVGIVQLPHDVKFGVESEQQRGLLYLSPAFFRDNRQDLAHLDLVDVRLERGMADYPRFLEAARSLAPNPAALSFVTIEQLRQAGERALDIQAIALIAFGVLAGVAGLVIVGQSVSRSIASSVDDARILAALGMARSGRLIVAMIPGVAVAICAAVVAVAAAIVASPLMPLGIAREIDPDVGFRVDAIVMAIGGVAIAVSLLLRSLRPAIVASSVATPEAGAIGGRSRPAAAGELVARAGISPSVVTGVRFATDGRAGRLVVPVRGALLGATAGILAIAASLTFGHSLVAAIDDPRAYGWNWDGDTAGSEDPASLARAREQLLRDPNVGELGRVDVLSVPVRGEQVKVFGFESIRGTIDPIIARGTAPRAADEAVVGSSTLGLFAADVGGSIELPADPDACASASPCTVRFRVVGEAVLPPLDDNELGHGIATTREGAERVSGTSGFTDHIVRLAPGVDTARAVKSFEDRYGGWAPPAPPSDVINLGRVERYPYALAGLLGVVALASIAHALVTSVRRRRRELAILKVVGFVRSQLALVVASQATTLIVMSVAVGVPLGIAAGRWAWRLAADRAALVASPLTPVIAVVAACAAALTLANVIAALPARAAGRTRAALVLRSE